MKKIVGIITEYNPFHNGHILHIKKTLEQSNADLLVCVMSSNYVMRGEFAVSDKFIRSEIALENGVDIVLELPFSYTLQSSDKFAYGAVKTLSNFGVTDIYFGSEANDIENLTNITKIKKTDKFKNELLKNLNSGLSYSKSIQNTLENSYSINYKSNDILGVNYIEAGELINKNIKFHTIQREHSEYHQTDTSHKTIASATSIRQMNNPSNYLPKKSFDNMLDKSISTHFETIKNKIITENIENLHLISEGIDKLLRKNIQIRNFDTFVDSIVNKRYTRSRVLRTLTSILLSITKEEIENAKEIDFVRILKMNEKAKIYLNENKKNLKTNVISNFKDIPEPHKLLLTKAAMIYDYELYLKDLKNIPIKK